MQPTSSTTTTTTRGRGTAAAATSTTTSTTSRLMSEANTRTWVVTGASGFIGSHMVRLLLALLTDPAHPQWCLPPKAGRPGSAEGDDADADADADADTERETETVVIVMVLRNEYSDTDDLKSSPEWAEYLDSLMKEKEEADNGRRRREEAATAAIKQDTPAGDDIPPPAASGGTNDGDSVLPAQCSSSNSASASAASDSATLLSLNSSGDRVAALRFATLSSMLEDKKNVTHPLPRVRVVTRYAPLHDENAVARALAPYETTTEFIFHFAAQGGDWGTVEEYNPPNVNGTLNMISFAQRCILAQQQLQIEQSKKPDCSDSLHATDSASTSASSPRHITFKKFVHASTVDVYPRHLLPADCHEGIPPAHDRRYPYSLTKSRADDIVVAASRGGGTVNGYHVGYVPVPAIVLRPGVVIGPGSMSWGLVEAGLMRKGMGLMISGGNHSSGAVDARDVCRAAWLAAHYKKTPSTSPATATSTATAATATTTGREICYNITNPHKSLTWRQFYFGIADGIGARRPTMSLPFWFASCIAEVMEWFYWLRRKYDSRPLLTHFLLRLVGRPQLWPITKAQTELGWEPIIPPEVTLQDQIKWLQKNKSLWEE